MSAERWTAAGAVGAAATWSIRHAWAMRWSGWTPPTTRPRRFGPLWARATGETGETGDAIVLLHGLVSTGDVYGGRYDRLALTNRLVVPDLLGFGRSIDEGRHSFGTEDHLAALDEMADRAGLFDSARWTVGAHSMGSAVALQWAMRHPDRIRRIVCWGAPVHASPDDARANLAGSTMARLFALDTSVAEWACGLSCRHRTAAGWLSAALEPGLPVAVARAAPQHTWPAYRDSMRQLVLDVDWSGLLTTCDRAGIVVELVWGADDRIGDPARAAEMTDGLSNVSVDVHETGDHRLPLHDPDTCIGRLVTT